MHDMRFLYALAIALMGILPGGSVCQTPESGAVDRPG